MADVVRLQFDELHYAQQLIFDDPARYKVLACGRRFGKTTLAKRVLYEGIIDQRGLPFAYFAPTNKMMSEVWRSVKSDLKPIITYTSEKERYLEFLTGAQMDFWSLDAADAPRGRTYAGVVIDEAALVRDQSVWQEVIRPMLTDWEAPLGWAYVLSTPKGRNWFFHLFMRGRSDDPKDADWNSWRFPTATNPALPPGEVDAAKADLTELAFDQEYLARFLEDSSTVFRGLLEVATGKEQLPITGESYVIGCDWGRKNDYTVLTVLRESDPPQMVYMDRFKEISWQMQRKRLKRINDRFQPRIIIAEENAAGEPIIEALRDEGLPVKAFYTSVSSKGPLIDALALAIERADVVLLNDRQLKDEFQAYEMSRLPSGSWRFSAPPGYHDDIVMSTALMWHGHVTKPAIMQQSPNIFYN